MTLEDIREYISELSASNEDELLAALDDIKSDLKSLTAEAQSYPIIANLDNAISELENINLDYYEPTDSEIEKDLAWWDEFFTYEQVKEKKREILQEWLNDKINEIKNIIV